MTETVDGKMMTNEFLGSLAVVYFMTSMAVGSSGVTNAMAAGLVLAVMMMALSGAMILPWITLGRVMKQEMDWQTGVLAWLMQILGGVVAWAIDWWVMKANNMNLAVETSFTSYLSDFNLDASVVLMTFIGSFLLMMVWSRLGGGWAMGIFAWMLMSGGIDVVSAGGVGGMIVTSSYGTDAIIQVFGMMVLGGVGAAAWLYFDEMVLSAEDAGKAREASE